MLSQSLVRNKAATLYTLPLLKLVICCVTYQRTNDKITLACLKYHRRPLHYSGDWQLQLPSHRDDQAVSTEAWVAVMILYGVMMWVLQHQQFKIVPFFSISKLVLVFFMLHIGLSLYCTESSNFLWMAFLPEDALASFLTDKICPGTRHKYSFHFNFRTLNWGNKDGFFGFGDIVIAFSNFDCLTLKVVKSAAIQPYKVSLEWEKNLQRRPWIFNFHIGQ